MVNVKLSSKFLLGYATVTAFVAVACACLSSLAIPTRAIVLEFSAFPQGGQFCRSTFSAGRQRRIGFSGQSFVPRWLAPHGRTLPARGRIQETFMTTVFASFATLFVKLLSALFASKCDVDPLGLARALATAMSRVPCDAVNQKFFSALWTDSLAALYTCFTATCKAACLWLFGSLTPKSDAAVFANKCLCHTPILPRLQEVGACQTCKVGAR